MAGNALPVQALSRMTTPRRAWLAGEKATLPFAARRA
jgi:hypothetical protein